MDIYALDSNRQREHVVDRFTSLVWSERYADVGDFDLDIHDTLLHRDIFRRGRWLITPKSHRVMVVESKEQIRDSEGRVTLKVTGPSLEKVLKDRVTSLSMWDSLGEDLYGLKDTPENILRYIVNEICIRGVLDRNDIIPGLVIRSLPGRIPDTTPESTEPVLIELKTSSIYEAFTDITTVYNVGYAFMFDPDTQLIHFQVLTGSDRLSSTGAGSWTLYPDDSTWDESDISLRWSAVPMGSKDIVVFSPEYENITDTKELESDEGYKNVAIVRSEYGQVTVYADGDAQRASGFNRRVMYVEATDIEEEDPDKFDRMRAQGLRALFENKEVYALEGSIGQNKFRYREDYDLGDLVELRAGRGRSVNHMQVIEQIFVDDREGEREYPTLSLEGHVRSDSWALYNGSATWHSLDPLLLWNGQSADA